MTQENQSPIVTHPRQEWRSRSQLPVQTYHCDDSIVSVVKLNGWQVERVQYNQSWILAIT
ncbi:MAG: hypothetical protein NW220_02715 [Leptolyngbyaceae cyanobacterium bins.349]|nr:hypothetical protein [Leptolyngbyaceae cyanobacterium bins.349]